MNDERRALGFGLAAVGCWSTVATAFKFTLGHVDTLQLLFYANLAACVVLCVLVAWQGKAGQLRRSLSPHWRTTLLAAALNPVLYYLLLFGAYDRLPAQAAMSINYTWAIVLAFLAVLVLKQTLIAADFIAAAVCYTGVVIIATRGDPAALTGFELKGTLLAVASTVIWAAYWIVNIHDPREPVIALCQNFLVALPVTGLLCVMLSDWQVTLTGLAGSLYVGVVEMAAGFVLWSTALRLTANTARVSNLIFLSPMMSLLLIYLVLGEEIVPATVVGLALILAGLYGQQRAHAKAAAGADTDPGL